MLDVEVSDYKLIKLIKLISGLSYFISRYTCKLRNQQITAIQNWSLSIVMKMNSTKSIDYMLKKRNIVQTEANNDLKNVTKLCACMQYVRLSFNSNWIYHIISVLYRGCKRIQFLNPESNIFRLWIAIQWCSIETKQKVIWDTHSKDVIIHIEEY